MSLFNGSIFLKNRVLYLLKEYGVKTVIETGTYHGATTTYFSEKVPFVITIEKDKEIASQVSKKLEQFDNIRLLEGDSRNKLEEAIEKSEGQVLLYLDAHSPTDNPIRSELKTIFHSSLENPIIVIHDFKVPSREDLGYNTYQDGSALKWKEIKDLVPENYSVDYNDEAPKGERGTIFLKRELLN